jgi:hypothetical protein
MNHEGWAMTFLLFVQLLRDLSLVLAIERCRGNIFHNITGLGGYADDETTAQITRSYHVQDAPDL